MIRSLPLLHRIAGQKVVVIGEGEMGEAKRRLVERAGGIPCGEPEAHQAKLAFIALEDEKAARAAAKRLSDKGLLVNVADMPELCEFTTPSILDRDLLDDLVSVTDEEAYRAGIEVARKDGIMVGPTTGAVLHAALQSGVATSGTAEAPLTLDAVSLTVDPDTPPDGTGDGTGNGNGNAIGTGDGTGDTGGDDGVPADTGIQ